MNQSSEALRRILGQGSIYTVGTLMRIGGGILVLPVLTRLVDPDEYGLIALALVVQALLAIVAAAGLPSVITRNYFFARAGVAGARALVVSTLLIALVLAMVLEITGPRWAGLFSDVGYDPALRVAVWTAVPVAALTAIQSLLRAEERPLAFVITVGLMSVGAQAVGIGFTLVDGTATAYLAGFGIGNLVALTAGLWLIRGEWPIPTVSSTRQALAIGLPIVPHGLALYVLNAGDRVVIEILEGIHDVGRYHLAYVVGSLSFFVVNALNDAWVPVTYKAPDSQRPALLAEVTATLALLAALLGAAVAFGAAPALEVLAPSDYELEELAPLSAVIAAAVVPLTVYYASVQVVLQTGRTGPMAYLGPAIAVVNLGLNFALIPLLGLTGAAVATLVAYTAQSALFVRLSQRLLPVPWKWRQVGGAAALCWALVAVAILEPSGGAWTAVRLGEVTLLCLIGAAVARGRSRAPA